MKDAKNFQHKNFSIYNTCLHECLQTLAVSLIVFIVFVNTICLFSY